MDALFLDRDGVINVNRPDHVKCWEQFRFVAGALQSLRRLKNAGIPVIIITNQAIVGRGMVKADVLEDIHRRAKRAIEWAGGQVLDILACPHAPEENCDCRKPRPGLLRLAAQRYDFDLSRCVLIGDAVTDIQAGQAVGCTTVLVRTGRGAEQFQIARQAGLEGYLLASDLPDAIDKLLGPPIRDVCPVVDLAWPGLSWHQPYSMAQSDTVVSTS